MSGAVVVGGDAEGERRSLGFSPTLPVPESEQPTATPAMSARMLSPEAMVFMASTL